MNWVVVALGLLGLIFIHELGHFLAAKGVGARATRFYVGFPPAILRKQVGDTEYGIGAVPVGGYVRIPGMNRPQYSDLSRIADALDEARLRDADVEAFAAELEALELALKDQRLDEVAPLCDRIGPELEAVAPVLHPRTLKQARKDLIRLTEDASPGTYWRLSTWRRITIIGAGPAANVLTAFVLFAVYAMIGIPNFLATTNVHAVTAGQPAAAAGIRAGDKIVQIGARPTKTPVDVTKAIQASAGRPISIVVRRNGARVTLGPVSARRELVAGESTPRWILGFQMEVVQRAPSSYSAAHAAQRSLVAIRSVTTNTFDTLVGMVTSSRARGQVSSTVGIVVVAKDSADQGWFLLMLGEISMALAIFNLLPILPLDGGHILFALIEKLRGGRPVPRDVFAVASVAGIAVVLLLVGIGLNNDIGRLTGH